MNTILDEILHYTSNNELIETFQELQKHYQYRRIKKY